MKKKPNLNNKEHLQRLKTPDLTSIKGKNKIKKALDNPNNVIPQITTNLQKKSLLKSSTIKQENKPPKKAKFVINKEKKEEPKTNTEIPKIERPKSANKKSLKLKASKREEKKDNIPKKNNETMNKTGDNFYKPKTQIKKSVINNDNNNNNNFDKLRRKSVDITLEKRNKKAEKEKDKIKTEKNLKMSMKIDLNKSKRQNLNKTTDNKKVRTKKGKKEKQKENEKEPKNIAIIKDEKIEEKKEEKKEIEKEIKKVDNINDNNNNNTNKTDNQIKEEKKEIIKEEKKIENKKEEKPEEKIEQTILKNKEILKEEIKKEIKKEEKLEELIKEIENEEKEEEIENKEKKVEEKPLEQKQEKKEEKISDIKEPKKQMKYIFMGSSKFSSNYKECLYLGLSSGFFNPVQKLKLMLNSKELYNNLDKKKLIYELIDNYNKLGNKNLKNKNNLEYDIEKINIPFRPCERSINSLNFIDKEEENKLINELQHPYIIEYFKLLLVILNEKKEENKNIFEFFFKDLLEKYKAKNIKNLLINVLVNNEININDEQFNSIQKMIMVKPDLLSPATLLRYNRAVAYSAFFLKDFFNYLNLKTEDGKYYYKLRTNLPKNENQDKIDKLKLLII